MEKRLRNNSGITLIALIITIIVILILVAVAVKIAVNSGLFGHAKNAVEGWKAQEKIEDEAINKIVEGIKNDDNKYIPVNNINFERSEYSMTGAGTITLNVLFSPENATNKNLSWTSEPNFTITDEGTISLPNITGDVTVTAVSEDGNKSASCIIHVTRYTPGGRR